MALRGVVFWSQISEVRDMDDLGCVKAGFGTIFLQPLCAPPSSGGWPLPPVMMVDTPREGAWAERSWRTLESRLLAETGRTSYFRLILQLEVCKETMLCFCGHLIVRTLGSWVILRCGFPVGASRVLCGFSGGSTRRETLVSLAFCRGP